VEPQSLVLVTVDCLRADHCGFYGYSRPTTPFLDELAAESFVVPTAVVAGAPTYFSFPAILASRMPLALGRDVIGLAPGESTLATALQEAGYATAAFSAANPYISPHFGYEQGFEVFRDFLDFGASPAVDDSKALASVAPSIRGRLNQSAKRIAQVVGLSWFYDELYFQYCARIAAQPVESIDALRKFPTAEVIIDHAISWLTSAGRRPFFLWLHFMDSHSPYYPTAAAYRELTGREVSASRARYLNAFWNRFDLTPARLEPKKSSVIELYDAGIRSVDDQIARLVGHLRQHHMWENCAFVLTADHGEEFLEHGRRYHAPVSFDEQVARVPLMIRVPVSGEKSVPETPFSHLHLAPTLLEILDVPAPHSFKGRSLWSNLQQGSPWDDPAVAECTYGCINPFRSETRLAPRLVSVRDARHKMALRIEPGTNEELYDLKTDAEGKRPLPPGAENEVRIRFLQSARKHITEAARGTDVVARLKARLRDVRVELEHNPSKVS
jgi:arylsulfatase A-like enzyme